MNLRSRYTWHLCPPHNRFFDSEHWWKQAAPKDITEIAAVYELARRHPEIGRLRSHFQGSSWHGMALRTRPPKNGEGRLITAAWQDLGNKPKAVQRLCLIGLLPWPKLSARNREYWISSCGKLKGVDTRDPIEKCTNIIHSAAGMAVVESITQNGHRPLSTGFTAKRKTSRRRSRANADQSPLFEFAKAIEPSLKPKIAAHVARLAIETCQAGHFLFSVAPDLKYEEAITLMSETYREAQKGYDDAKSRSRWESWLPAIEAFEGAEMSQHGAKSPTFTRYRRVIDGVTF